MNSSNRNEWPVLQAKLREFLSVYDRPVPPLEEVHTIPDAPIGGSGKLTMAVDGTHRHARYHFTRADFWAIVLRPDCLFQKHHIRQVSAFVLGLEVGNASGEPAGFRHVQDMSSAEIRSDLPLEGGMLHVRSLVLAQQDLVLLELTSDHVEASVSLRLKTANEYRNFFITGDVHDSSTVFLRKEHTSFMTFNAAAALTVRNADAVRAGKNTDDVTLSFRVVPGRTARVWLSVKGGKDEYRHLAGALAAVEEAGAGDVAAMLVSHEAWWRDYWLRSWVVLNDDVLERYYYGAQYVHGCSIDPGGRTVPGLAGGWITSDNPIWGGTYTMNYNGEAPFWGLMSSNRGDWILPYARVCLDYIPSGRALATRLDTKGIVMPVMIGPWGVPDNDDALGQKSNASLAALALVWHYEMTRDRAFLEHYLYPFLRELMDFWEVNVEVDASGRYVIAESATRERTPGDLNPGPELGYLRRLLGSALECSEELGVDRERRDTWRDILSRLSDYPVMEVNGGLCYMEAENRMEVSITGVGDNPVVLDHVYPGGAIDDDPTGKGRIIARNTLRYLQSWNQGNGFPRIFSQAVRAGWPGGELLDLFKARITRGPGPHEIVRGNNTFIPDDHSYEGSGSTEFINAMLAQANSGVLAVFEVWPRDREASFYRLRVRDAFLVSGVLKGGTVEYVEILSEKGRTCRMKSCWPGRATQVSEGGNPVEVRSDAGVFSWPTRAGLVYRVTAGKPVEEVASNPPVMLVPVIEPAVRARRSATGAAIDMLLTPEIRTTRLAFDVVYADEGRRRCTAECRFTVRDPRIASILPDGTITAGESGRTCVDVAADIDGIGLSACASLYVLNRHVIMDMAAAASGGPPRGWIMAHTMRCITMGDGTDGPDVTSLHRSNAYGVGLFVFAPDEDGSRWITFDLGRVYALDEMFVWNYNCPENYRVLWWNGGVAVGVRDVMISCSVDGTKWETLANGGRPFRLARASGKQWMPPTNLDDGKNTPIRFGGARARYVKLSPDPAIGVGNWGAERFGLAQVRFTYRP